MVENGLQPLSLEERQRIEHDAFDQRWVRQLRRALERGVGSRA